MKRLNEKDGEMDMTKPVRKTGLCFVGVEKEEER